MNPAKTVVLITGGASGIGLACGRQAAAGGASIAVVDLNGEAARAAIAGFLGGPHVAVEADVADADSMREAVATIVRELGALTGVVAAAGIVTRTPLKDVSTEEFRRVFSINVEGIQNTISAAAPHLIEAGEAGAIVALASVAAYLGGGLMGSGVYGASKAAVVGLVRGYARELAPWHVRVNAVAPAATDTPMTSVLTAEERAAILRGSLTGRFARAEEIAATVNFLLSPGAAAITGQVVQPNGGVYFN